MTYSDFLKMFLTSLIFLVTFHDHASAESHGDGWIPLFNGKDLTGWHISPDRKSSNNTTNLFTADNNEIHAYKNADDIKDRNVGVLISNLEFSHYHLRFQYQWGKKRFGNRSEKSRDSGLFYHCVNFNNDKPNKWPKSLEFQIGENETGNLFCIGGTRCTTSINPKKQNIPQYFRGKYLSPENGGISNSAQSAISANIFYDQLEGWNSVDLIVMGSDYVIHMVNGRINNRLSKLEQRNSDNTWAPLSSGSIQLQANLAEVSYRDIKIKPISTGPFCDRNFPIRSVRPPSFRNEEFILGAETAHITGPNLRFQPDENNTIGYWNDVKDKTSWKIDVKNGGGYYVELTWSVDNSHAGKEFQIVSGKSKLVSKVKPTGGWADYKTEQIGHLMLPKGIQTITIEATGPFEGALMDIKQLRLINSGFTR